MNMNSNIIERMRNYLNRDYGIALFQYEDPIFAVRIPKESIKDFDKEDSDNIIQSVCPYFEQIKEYGVIYSFIISDESYIRLDPIELFEEMDTQICLMQNIGTRPIDDILAPKQTLCPDLVVSENEENKEYIIVSSAIQTADESQVREILDGFAKGRGKKIVKSRIKSGRRAEILTRGKRGRYIRYKIPKEGENISDIAIAPTVRAAALHAVDGKLDIKKSDMREKIRRRKVSTLILIDFDASGSMDESKKINITRGAVLALLKDAYQRRDKVALVTYSGRKADLILPFSSSVELAKRYLEKIHFGGTTPLASGLLMGFQVLQREIKKEPSAIPILVLVTDGTANVPLEIGGNIERELYQICRYLNKEGINVLVVDISASGSDLARKIADTCAGKYYHPDILSKEILYYAITDERDSVAGYG
ncbi:MAG TPA: VWA domain-containing protein [Methanosarcinales archaeon]|nr:VWA domain-containing protein [Methanosarcinales archaeon]